MKYLLSLLAASLMLAAASCNHGGQSGSSAVQEVLLPDIKSEEAPPPPPPGTHQKDEQQPTAAKANTDWDKKIIKTATLNVEVVDFKKYNNQIHQLTQQWEGYIAKEEENSSDESIRNVVTIKVPAARFDDALNSISSLEGEMLVKQVSSQDVTSEVFDTRVRMEAKKKIRLRYLDMLQKAKNMEEILQVEREINQVQEQIEAAEGRLNYLTHTSSFSTIELTFFQLLMPGKVNVENPGYGQRFLLALNDGLRWVGNCFIFFATVWPLWVFLLILFIVLKKVRFVSVNTKN